MSTTVRNVPGGWPAASRYGTPEDSVGYLLWQVLHMWQRRASVGLGGLDLTHLQFTLLAGVGWLCREGDPPSQARVAEHCQLDPMSVSQVIRKLEAKGLVTRSGHPEDTRAKAVRITERGLAALSDALPLIGAMDDAFFAAADRKALRNELLKLYRAQRPSAPAWSPAEETQE